MRTSVLTIYSSMGSIAREISILYTGNCMLRTIALSTSQALLPEVGIGTN